MPAISLCTVATASAAVSGGRHSAVERSGGGSAAARPRSRIELDVVAGVLAADRRADGNEFDPSREQNTDDRLKGPEVSVNEAFRVVRERWRIVAGCFLLGTLCAAALTMLMPRVYSSDLTIYVSLQGQTDNSDAAYQASELAKQRVVSYAPLVTDARITQPVIDELQLGITPEQLASRITVTVEPDTVVLVMSVQDNSAEQAAAIANAVGEEFVGLVSQLEQPIGPAASAPSTSTRGATATVDPTAPAQITAQIIRPATASPTPVSPNPPFNIALGAAISLLIGLAAAFVRDARDSSVRTAERLHELTAVPVLSEVEYDSGASRRPLSFDDRLGSPRTEAFRKLRTNLQFPDQSGGHKIIVVTSALPEEGVSTTATNLAIAMAYAGNRVLLMDANLRRPKVAGYLMLDNRRGLVHVLSGRMPLRAATVRCNEGLFDVLPAGPVPPNPSELLASRRMADLLAEARQTYNYVIVDAPALLPVTDAAVVAARADGTVLVVRHRRTTEDQVASAMDTLEAVSARLFGTVLSMTPRAHRPRAHTYRESPQVVLSSGTSGNGGARPNGEARPNTDPPTEATPPINGGPRPAQPAGGPMPQSPGNPGAPAGPGGPGKVPSAAPKVGHVPGGAPAAPNGVGGPKQPAGAPVGSDAARSPIATGRPTPNPRPQ